MEDGARIAQDLVPRTEGDRFDEATIAEDPFGPGGVLSMAQSANSPRYPVGAACIDGEVVQGPDQEGGYDNPLGRLQHLGQGPPHPRVVGCCKLRSAVDEVEAEQRKAVGQAGVASAYIEGDGDGEDDGQEKDGTRDDTEEPPHGRGDGGCCRAERARRLARAMDGLSVG